jgi:MFS family permease
MAKADAIETTRATTMQVALLIGSGMISAAQVGKEIISLPLRGELTLGLDLAGLIVVALVALAAFMGIGADAIVGRAGVRRSLIGGMALIALGNVIGACAPDERVLLAARIIEGSGFFGSILAIPIIIARTVTPARRDVITALWSTYGPAGIALMLLVGPLLPTIGWRGLWLANAVVAGTCAVLLGVLLRAQPRQPCHTVGRLTGEIANPLHEAAWRRI